MLTGHSWLSKYDWFLFFPYWSLFSNFPPMIMCHLYNTFLKVFEKSIQWYRFFLYINVTPTLEICLSILLLKAERTAPVVIYSMIYKPLYIKFAVSRRRIRIKKKWTEDLITKPLCLTPFVNSPSFQRFSSRDGPTPRGFLDILGGGPFLVVRETSEHYWHLVGRGKRS